MGRANRKRNSLWYLVLPPLLVTAFGFLPLSLPAAKKQIAVPGTLLVEHQECGCPCPNARIISGTLQIPDSIRRSHPDIQTHEINLTGDQPYGPTYSYELSLERMVVRGRIVGVDTISCDVNGCECTPRFEVSSWQMAGYFPRFWAFNSAGILVFFVSLLLSANIAVCYLAYLVIRGFRAAGRRTWKR